MEEAQGETFLWHELRENFIKYFIFIPQDKKLVKTAKKNQGIYRTNWEQNPNTKS